MTFRILVFIFVSFLAYKVQVDFIPLEYFNIKTIKINKNSKIYQNELTELTKKIYNKNSWYLNLTSLRESLLKDIRLDDIEFNIDKLGELTVDIKEKEVAYLAQIKDTIYVLNYEGIVFGYLNEKDRDIGIYPLIVSKDGTDIGDIISLLNNIDKSFFKDNISQCMKVTNNEFLLFLNDGSKIITNPLVSEDKYNTLNTLYSELSKKNKIQYIDIRFNDFIIGYLGDGDE